MTLRDLVLKYGTAWHAAGALAFEIERMPAEDFMRLPEAFRSLVLFRMGKATLYMTYAAAGTPLERLQQIWRDSDEEEA